jgi:hypothetical protein
MPVATQVSQAVTPQATSVDASWENFFLDRLVLVDLAVFFFLALIHFAALWEARSLSRRTQRIRSGPLWKPIKPFPTTGPERQFASDSLRTSTVAGLTAVGILLPLSLLVFQIGEETESGRRTFPPPKVFLDVFIADAWFAASLVFGIWILWRSAVSLERHPLSYFDVVLFFGFQLFALLLGVARLTLVIFTLVQSR